MNSENLSRRRALQTVAAFVGTAALGCGDQTHQKERATSVANSEPTPAPKNDTQTTGWELIAEGDSGPGPRSRHGLVYDRSAGRAVLFGGIVWDDGGILKADTWELRGRKWLEIKATTAPLPRHRLAMVYLDHVKQTLLFGGQSADGGFLGDAWAYSHGQWQPVPSSGQMPPPRCGHCMAYDEQARCAVLFGGIAADGNALGDTWIFDGENWKEIEGVSPPARRYAALAFDPGLKACVLHGGAEDDHGRRTYGDTWLLRGRGWTRLDSSFDTNPRDDHALAFHVGAAKLVMLEGLSRKRGLLVMGKTRWEPVEASPLHPQHQCSPLAWDEDLGGLLLQGGEARHGGPQFDQTLLLRMPYA